MGKRILLIGYNYAPEPTGIGKYSGEMIQWLAKKGYDCTVLTTYPYYPYWKVQEPYYKNRFYFKSENQTFEGGGEITVHRCPIYVPAQPTGRKRIMLDLSFLVTAFFQLLKLLQGKKFDHVVTVVPSFQFGLLGVLYKKLRKAKLIYHIQDMQIEAARDLGMIKSEKVIRGLFQVEKFIFNQSDVVTSISEGMVAKIGSKAGKEISLFPNWTDTKQFYPLHNREELKKEFGFEPSDYIILYSGGIGEKQGLESILYAAMEFRENKDVKFVICGSGPYKEKLQNLAKSLELQYVVFFPLQPFDKFNQFLNIADLHLVIQKANASDLVMPSKLTTILSVGGVPLVTANKGAGLHSLVEKYQMGILVKAEDQQALNEGINKAISSNNESVKERAREYAENFLSIDNVMREFETLLA